LGRETALDRARTLWRGGTSGGPRNFLGSLSHLLRLHFCPPYQLRLSPTPSLTCLIFILCDEIPTRGEWISRLCRRLNEESAHRKNWPVSECEALDVDGCKSQFWHEIEGRLGMFFVHCLWERNVWTQGFCRPLQNVRFALRLPKDREHFHCRAPSECGFVVTDVSVFLESARKKVLY
jgi:hypothetical protein